jgi:hypothetical protein
MNPATRLEGFFFAILDNAHAFARKDIADGGHRANLAKLREFLIRKVAREQQGVFFAPV